MPHLTQKERMLLQDQLNHEQICITKYSGYASRTKDPEIRRMFYEFASEEQQHYDTINNLLQGSGQSQGQSQGQSTQQQSGTQAGRRHQAGSQGAGWQATGNQSMTGNVGQTGGQAGTTQGSQTDSYQATSGGSGQNWMSETRTVYGGQITQGTQSGGGQSGQMTRRSQGSQSNQSHQGIQGTQGAGLTQQSQQTGLTQGTQSQRGSLNFEAGSELSMSTSDDKSMLEDMLMTEKYISGAYDTAVFETSNQQVKQALQHIQRDEQKHGEQIFNYMQQRGMYQPQ